MLGTGEHDDVAAVQVGRPGGEADVRDVGEGVELVEVGRVRVADDGDGERVAARDGAHGGALFVG